MRHLIHRFLPYLQSTKKLTSSNLSHRYKTHGYQFLSLRRISAVWGANWKTVCFLLGVTGLMLKGCLPSESLLIRQAKHTLTTELTPETFLKATFGAFPKELTISFDRTHCPDYCWHGLFLGQNVTDAIEAIENDPQTAKELSFDSSGSYLHISKLRDTHYVSTVSWFLLDLPEWQTERIAQFSTEIPYHDIDTLYLDDKNQRVNSLIVPLNDRFPFQTLIDILGEPEYVSIPIGDFFHVHYLTHRISFRVRRYGSSLQPQSWVEGVTFLLNVPTDYPCIIWVTEWRGFGGFGTYYTKSWQAPQPARSVEQLSEQCRP